MLFSSFHEKCPLWVVRLFPFIRWLPLINGSSARRDLVAGLTGAIVVLPQGVAFANIAGMPPQYGLYAGMVPAIVAALFGSSWHLVSGPTTAASMVLASAISAAVAAATTTVPGTQEYMNHYVLLALTLTFMVGIIQLAMGLARMGTLVNFISHSVVIGFTAGAAILIASSQLKNFLGLDIERGNHLHETLYHVFMHISDSKWAVIVVGSVTIAAGLLCKRYTPRIPYMIVAMFAGSAVSIIFNAMWGQEFTGIKTVGALPQSFPPLSAPDLSLDTIRDLAPAALAVTLFALTEAVSIARSLAARSNQILDGNQEFIGQGLSNIAGSFFSGYVATGSFNRSGLNYQAGAKTPLAAVFAGLLLIVVVLLVAPYAAYLPNAAMAGILFMVAYGLIDMHHIKKIVFASRSEALILIATFAATLFLKLEFAIFLGVMLSLGLYLNRTAHPKILSRVPDASTPRRKFTTDSQLPECPQLKLIRIDGSLFFGAVSYLQEKLHGIEAQYPEQKHLAIVSSGINFIDIAGAECLVGESSRRRKQDGGLYLIRVKGSVRETLNRGTFLKEFGEENIFQGKTHALSHIFEKLDKDICSRCEKRIFLECQKLPPPVPGQR